MTRILLVDDVDLFLELERTFLRRFGCEILTARTGEEALEKVRVHRPDLILLDVVMPGIGGYEVCRILKANPETREIPVIFVAGDPDLRRMAEVGGNDLVAKPIRREALLDAIRKHVPISERESIRIPINLRVKVEGAERGSRTLYSKDLSQDGIFLRNVPGLPVGKTLGMRLRLPFPEGIEEIEASGEVVRQVQDRAESHLIPGVGIRFVGLGTLERATVGRFVRRRLQPER
jgi:CheY-like chemotaxis protein